MKSSLLHPGVLLAALVCAGYVAFLAHLGTAHPLDYHLTDDDYTQHSLAHGLSSEAFLRGEPAGRRDWFQLMHPGIPFQVASWLALRASYPVRGQTTQQIVDEVLADPAPFWRTNLLMASAIMLAGLVVLAVATARIFGASYAPVALLLLLAHPVTVKTSYFALGNETFCTLLGALMMLAGLKALADPKALAWSAAAGALAALCYLNKLNYIAWGVGLGLGYVTAIVLDPPRRGRRFAGLVVCGLAAGAVTLLLTELWLGHKSVVRMAFLHLGVAMKSGYYGLGSDNNVVDFASVSRAVVSFFSESPAYSLLLLLVLAAPWLALLRGGQDGVWNAREKLPALVFLSSALVLALLAAFKHYNLHYTLTAAIPAVFLAGFFWITLGRMARAGFVALVLVALAVNGIAVHHETRKAHANQAEDLAMAARIRELPREAGEVIVWGYRAPVPEYLDSFTLDIFPDEASRRLLPSRHPGSVVGEIFTGFKPEPPGRLQGPVGAARYFVFYLGERRGNSRTVRDRFAQAKAISGHPQRVVLESPRWLVVELDPPLPPVP